MAITVPNVTMLAEGLTGTQQDKQGQETIAYKVPFGYVHQFMSEMLGGIVTAGGTRGLFKKPERHPRRSGYVASSANYIPMGKHKVEFGVIAYDWAKVFVGFLPLDKNPIERNPINANVVLRERRSSAATVLVPKPGSIKWNDGPDNGKEVAEPPGVIQPDVDWTLEVQYWQTSKIENGDLDEAIGTVNSDSWKPLFSKWKVKRLMFMGYDFEKSYILTEMGNLVADSWNVVLSFSYRRKGWDKLYSPTDGGYHTIKTKDGSDVYEPQSFESLFNWKNNQPGG